ncbi:MAG: substrate-binding domain-containing protein [Micrococcales bacterium]|nr:substrate-binding domain-containing protein [Micrococcales bacterium]
MVRRAWVRGVVGMIVAVALVGGCSRDESPPVTQEGVNDDDPAVWTDDGGAWEGGDVVAVSLPEGFGWYGDDPTAVRDAYLKAAVEEAGFRLLPFVAGDKPLDEQVFTAIDEDAKAMVIGAAAGVGDAGPYLDAMKANGTWIISYGRLLENTAAVDAVVQYGIETIGRLQAETLVQGLEEKKPGGPWTVELFAGEATDPNARLLYEAAMEVLQPLLDEGVLSVGSGTTGFADVATTDWDGKKARIRMKSTLTTSYQGKGPDGVLVPNDGIARSILKACQSAGFDTPVVVGLDAERESVLLVREGAQYATIHTPEALIIDKTVEVVAYALANSALPPTDNSVTNGAKAVARFEVAPLVITQATVDEVFPCSTTDPAAAEMCP